jgi:ubiquinol-cytochrome c reductase cytochrome b subunit
MLAVAALLFALGGLVQINPIWLWGPYEPALGTNGAQPDWYLGWLIGALRLVPGFDVTIGDYTLIPNPFWGGVLFPTIVLVVLVAWPWVERRVTRDRGIHNVLDRPRDAPVRTAMGASFLTWVALIFVAGSADRATTFFGLDYEAQIWVYRVAVWVLPVLAGVVTHRFCRELLANEVVEKERHEAEHEAEQEPDEERRRKIERAVASLEAREEAGPPALAPAASPASERALPTARS